MFWDKQRSPTPVVASYSSDGSESGSYSEESDSSDSSTSHDHYDDAGGGLNTNTTSNMEGAQTSIQEEDKASSGSNANESILLQALRELEKERAKRLELEETIAAMREQRQSQHQGKTKRHKDTKRRKTRKKNENDQSRNITKKKTSQESYLVHSNDTDNDTASLFTRKQFAAIQQELKGYRQLVDVLTMGRPAMVAAANATRRRHRHQCDDDDDDEDDEEYTGFNNSNDLLLPLHTTRFLELMPWHPRAHKAAVVVEELYEWQVYHPLQEAWSSQVANFPTFFQALPLVCPAWNHGRALDTSSERPLSLPPTNEKVGVWTNDNISHRFELRDGYLIPSGPNAPRWKWIGGWFVDGPSQAEYDAGECKRDREGWSYAKEAGDFLQSSLLLPPPSIAKELEEISEMHRRASGKTLFQHIFVDKGKDSNTFIDKSLLTTTVVRRRKWFRKRVLVDYPHASEATIHYLKLLEQTEEMKLTLYMLHRQLLITRHALQNVETQYTADHQLWNDDKHRLEQQLDDLERQVKQQELRIQRQEGPNPTMFSSLYGKVKASNSDKQSVNVVDDQSTDESTTHDDDDDENDDCEDQDHGRDQDCKGLVVAHLPHGVNVYIDASAAPGSKAAPPVELPSQIKMIEGRKDSGHSRNNSGSSFFMKWINCTPKPGQSGQSTTPTTQTETESEEFAPEAEPCSDDNSSCLSSAGATHNNEADHHPEVSEQPPFGKEIDVDHNKDHTKDDELTQYSTDAEKQLQPQERRSSKTFLNLPFFKV